MTITFFVENQIIKRTDCQQVVADSQNYLYAAFSFTDDWGGIITAFFTHGDNTYAEILDEGNTCLVPWEVIKADSFTVSCVCGSRITANTASVYVQESGYREGETPQPPTPDIYEQLLARLQAKLSANQGRENAGKVMTVGADGILIPAKGGSASVDFDDTITQDETTGKYGIDFAEFSLDNDSFEDAVKAIDAKHFNGYMNLLKGLIGDAIDAKADKSKTYTMTQVNALLAGKQPTGNYALKTEIPAVENSTGTSTTAAISQKAATDAINEKQNALSTDEDTYIVLSSDVLENTIGSVTSTVDFTHPTSYNLLTGRGLLTAEHFSSWLVKLINAIQHKVELDDMASKQDKPAMVTLTNNNTIEDVERATHIGFYVEDNKDYIGSVAFSELAIAFGGVLIPGEETACHHSTLLFKTASTFTKGITILTDSTDVVMWHGAPVTFEEDTLYELDFRCETIDNIRYIIIAGGALEAEE